MVLSLCPSIPFFPAFMSLILPCRIAWKSLFTTEQTTLTYFNTFSMFKEKKKIHNYTQICKKTKKREASTLLLYFHLEETAICKPAKCFPKNTCNPLNLKTKPGCLNEQPSQNQRQLKRGVMFFPAAKRQRSPLPCYKVTFLDAPAEVWAPSHVYTRPRTKIECKNMIQLTRLVESQTRLT